MKTLIVLLAMVVVLLASVIPVRAAAPFDGSVPLLCAAIEVMECAAGEECHRRTPEAVNLPQFFNIDVRAKSIGAADGSRTAPVQRVDQANGRVILQGGQEGRAWSIVIAADTGKLSASVVEQSGGFVIFGACTAR